MEQEIKIAELILEDIVVNDADFSDALRKVFLKQADLRPFRPIVSGLVGCELRHHLLFNYLVNAFSDEQLSKEEKRLLTLCMSNYYFYKRFNSEEMLAYVKDRLGDEKFNLVSEHLFKDGGDCKNLIPEHFTKTASNYLSLRFNTPEWVLKIWFHFEHGVTYKILKKNSKQLTPSIRVRTSQISVEELLDKNQAFAKTPVDSILVYGGKEPLRKLEEFKSGKIFLEKCGTKNLLDNFSIYDPDQIFCYCGNKDDSVVLELIERFGRDVAINIGLPLVEKPENVKEEAVIDEHLSLKKFVKTGCYSNINVFNANPDSMNAYISKPQDFVFAVPNSTNFDLIREKPDYLLHFKKEKMDALFKQEKDVLENSASFVAEGGTLVYLIYTISKKEGENTIKDFLTNHNEFKLVKMEQRFPFDKYDTSMFYAILKKETPLAKAGMPLNEVQSQNILQTANIGAKQGE